MCYIAVHAASRNLMQTSAAYHPEGSAKNLDWAQFEAITCGFLPEFIEIYREFERETPKLLKDLETAIDSSSSQTVANLAHQIKGSAANFGFIGTGANMHQLEREAKNQCLLHAEKHLAAAREAFEEAQHEIHSRLSDGPSCHTP